MKAYKWWENQSSSAYTKQLERIFSNTFYDQENHAYKSQLNNIVI